MSPLFDFELLPIEDIAPWVSAGTASLSWFALTLGRFRVHAGGQVLFRYSPEILAHWGTDERDAEYQVAAFARDVFATVPAAMTPLPDAIAAWVGDGDALEELSTSARGNGDDDYVARRWLGERSPWMSYLVESPRCWVCGCRPAMRCRRDRWQCDPWLSFFTCALSAVTLAEPDAAALRRRPATSSNLLVSCAT